MNYYFDGENRLQISSSKYSQMRKDIEKIYSFDHVSLPLGSGFSQFLNCDIEKWGNGFLSLLTQMINGYSENELTKYIEEAKSIFSEIAYFSVYQELFYNDILPLSLHSDSDSLIRTCKKIYDDFTSKEICHPLIYNNRPQKIEGEIDRLKKIQILFVELTDLCLIPSVDDPIKSLFLNQEKTFNERSFKLEESLSPMSRPGNNIRFEVNKISEDKFELVEVHTTIDVYDVIYEEFIKLANNNLRVKRCINEGCNKYFVPENRFDTLYCDECKNAGAAMKKYQEKVRNDPLLAAYNRAYQAKYAKLVKPFRSNIKMKKRQQDTLKSWVYEAKTKISMVDNLNNDEREKAFEELIQWLNER